MTEAIAPGLVATWEAANLELTHAQLNYDKPRMDDSLEEVRQRLSRAYAGVADAYEAVLADSELPEILTAALRDAREYHRACSTSVPPR